MKVKLLDCYLLLTHLTSVQVHAWAEISLHGHTGACIFTRIIDRYVYLDISEKTLLPCIRDVYREFHCFMADNDPKHNSNYARYFLVANNINWWRTSAEFADLNPLENVWYELGIQGSKASEKRRIGARDPTVLGNT